jgi:hypothetical protein
MLRNFRLWGKNAGHFRSCLSFEGVVADESPIFLLLLPLSFSPFLFLFSPLLFNCKHEKFATQRTTETAIIVAIRTMDVRTSTLDSQSSVESRANYLTVRMLWLVVESKYRTWYLVRHGIIPLETCEQSHRHRGHKSLPLHRLFFLPLCDQTTRVPILHRTLLPVTL